MGDHPVNDVIGSKNCGWQALWYNPGSEEWPQDLLKNVTENLLEESMADMGPNGQIQKLSELQSLLKI